MKRSEMAEVVSRDFKKLQQKIASAKWYAKNKEKYKAKQRKKYNTDTKYRKRKLKLQLENYHKDPEYRKVRYGATMAEWGQKNREHRKKYKAKWDKKNKDKYKEYYKKYSTNKKLGIKSKTRYNWI